MLSLRNVCVVAYIVTYLNWFLLVRVALSLSPNSTLVALFFFPRIAICSCCIYKRLYDGWRGVERYRPGINIKLPFEGFLRRLFAFRLPFHCICCRIVSFCAPLYLAPFLPLVLCCGVCTMAR